MMRDMIQIKFFVIVELGVISFNIIDDVGIKPCLPFYFLDRTKYREYSIGPKNRPRDFDGFTRFEGYQVQKKSFLACHRSVYTITQK